MLNTVLLILGVLLLVLGIVLIYFAKKPPTATYKQKISLGFGITFIVISVIMLSYGLYKSLSNNDEY